MKQRPDGDIEIDERFWEEDFTIPTCHKCNGALKPDVGRLVSFSWNIWLCLWLVWILQPVSFVQIFCSLLLWLVISGGKRSIRNHNYYYINYGSETVNLRTHLPTAHKRKGKKKQNKKFHEMQWSWIDTSGCFDHQFRIYKVMIGSEVWPSKI